jgi:hypothetical protein
VTVGGLPSAIAALNNAKQKPFLSLIGGTTPEFDGTITTKFYGGINLDTFKHNGDRIDKLLNYTGGSDPTKIWLLVHQNTTGMTPHEVEAWTGGTVIYVDGPSDFPAAFQQFDTGNAVALVVSASPMLQENKTILVAEAKKHNKRVCYPLRIYADAGPTGKYTIHGPHLAPAYYNLGVKVGNVLQTSMQSDLTPVDIGAPDHHGQP